MIHRRGAESAELPQSHSLRGLCVLCVSAALFLAGCGAAGGGSSGSPGGGAAAPASGAGAPGAFTVAAVDPQDGALNVLHASIVRLTFANAEVDPSTVDAQSFFILNASTGAKVAGRIAVQPFDATFTPNAPLLGATTFEVHATQAIRSTRGDALPAAVLTTFATAAGGTRSQPLRAGAAVVDMTPPVGVPLGGFGDGRRRLDLPDLNPFNYNTFLAASRGQRDPILAKALVLDDGVDRVALITVDLIATGANGERKLAQHLAAAGSQIRPEDVMICASHTHSGPGTLSPLHFWEIAAMDLYQPAVFDDLMRKLAQSVILAEQALEPARLGVGTTQLRGISKNRRAGVSPVYTHDTIDPELAVIRVDKANGDPLATLYNYAIHGLAFWNDNLDYSADLMGDASRVIEAQVGGAALFANGAEGDIAPIRTMGATDDERSRNIGKVLGDAVVALRATIGTDTDVDVASAAESVDMGTPFLFLSSSRLQFGTPAIIQNVMSFFGWGFAATIPLGSDLMDHEYRFQAVRLDNAVIASVPGEAIHEVGLEIKREGRNLGFDPALVFGLANGHMSYITTEPEYWVGGYEGIACLFGPKAGEDVRNHCARLMARVR